jgi:hypothetical protein
LLKTYSTGKSASQILGYLEIQGYLPDDYKTCRDKIKAVTEEKLDLARPFEFVLSSLAENRLYLQIIDS